MNNTKTMLSDREQRRTDFSDAFLCDLANRVSHGHDPYNWIGLGCGISIGRAFQIWEDRGLGYA